MFFFFFNDTATTEIYTLSLHDALPIWRISRPGSVKVSKLFAVERYRSLFQMTSVVTSGLDRNTSVREIFSALFPCGSVTGAPKIRTMQIISELENYPRGVYCGAIGYIAPDKRMCFNVAIRTIHIDAGRRGVLGTGGGIVYDSCKDKEYKEACLKARFFVKPQPAISLIESIRFSEKKGYHLLGSHLQRLRRSCVYFDIPVDISQVKNRLIVLGNKLSNDHTVYKVRLVIDANGEIQISSSKLIPFKVPITLQLSSKAVSSRDIYLYHKTTRRDFYNQARKIALRQGYGEVIFTNEKGELTEGAISNIFIVQKDMMFTPPVTCGLLAGVLRRHLLHSRAAREKILYPRDLLAARKIFIGNSLRGLVEAVIQEHFLR